MYEQSNIVLKIAEGTVKGSGSLCRTCRNAHIVRGVNNQQIVFCSASMPTRELHYQIAECNRYFNACEPTLYEMEEIAWRLVTKQAGRAMGFVNASEFRKLQEYKDGPSNPPPSR